MVVSHLSTAAAGAAATCAWACAVTKRSNNTDNAVARIFTRCSSRLAAGQVTLAEGVGHRHRHRGLGLHELRAVLGHLGPHFLFEGDRLGSLALGLSAGHAGVGFGGV